MTPLLLTADCISASAALAVIMTRPPSALIIPLFSASASTAPASTVRLIRPSPLKSSDTWLPAPRAVLPPGVVMVPSFVTLGAISATTPPGSALMVPWLRMVPAVTELWKLYFPSRKSRSSMSSDEATRPPTSTRALLPKRIPEGLIKKILPLAESDPMIWVGF